MVSHAFLSFPLYSASPAQLPMDKSTPTTTSPCMPHPLCSASSPVTPVMPWLNVLADALATVTIVTILAISLLMYKPADEQVVKKKTKEKNDKAAATAAADTTDVSNLSESTSQSKDSEENAKKKTTKWDKEKVTIPESVESLKSIEKETEKKDSEKIVNADIVTYASADTIPVQTASRKVAAATALSTSTALAVRTGRLAEPVSRFTLGAPLEHIEYVRRDPKRHPVIQLREALILFKAEAAELRAHTSTLLAHSHSTRTAEDEEWRQTRKAHFKYECDMRSKENPGTVKWHEALNIQVRGDILEMATLNASLKVACIKAEQEGFWRNNNGRTTNEDESDTHPKSDVEEGGPIHESGSTGLAGEQKGFSKSLDTDNISTHHDLENRKGDAIDESSSTVLLKEEDDFSKDLQGWLDEDNFGIEQESAMSESIPGDLPEEDSKTRKSSTQVDPEILDRDEPVSQNIAAGESVFKGTTTTVTSKLEAVHGEDAKSTVMKDQDRVYVQNPSTVGDDLEEEEWPLLFDYDTKGEGHTHNSVKKGVFDEIGAHVSKDKSAAKHKTEPEYETNTEYETDTKYKTDTDTEYKTDTDTEYKTNTEYKTDTNSCYKTGSDCETTSKHEVEPQYRAGLEELSQGEESDEKNKNKADEHDGERQSESMEESKDGKEGVPRKMARCRGPRTINQDQRFLLSSGTSQFQSTLWVGTSFNFGSPGSGAAKTASSLGVNLIAENPLAMPAAKIEFTFGLGAPTVSSMVKKVGKNTLKLTAPESHAVPADTSVSPNPLAKLESVGENMMGNTKSELHIKIKEDKSEENNTTPAPMPALVPTISASSTITNALMATLSPMAGHGSVGNSFSTPDLEEHHRQKQMQQKHANLDMMHMAKDEATTN
ncbi:hypothetical protein BGZ59_000584 [Podila verticillata]|nr:hypothetical protein BGZ59_000584 [Podila verticillata]